jgi:hypothetical protein
MRLAGTECMIPLALRNQSEEPIKSSIKVPAVTPDDTDLLSQLRVFRVRNEAVLIDSDLAAVYGVATKIFNKAIQRHSGLASKKWTQSPGGAELVF